MEYFSRKRSEVLASSLKYVIDNEDAETLAFLCDTFTTDGNLDDEFWQQIDRVDIGIESDTAQENFDQLIESIDDVTSDSLWIKQHARKKFQKTS